MAARMLRAADEVFPKGYKLDGSPPRQTVSVRGGTGVDVGVAPGRVAVALVVVVAVGVETPIGPLQAARMTVSKAKRLTRTKRRSGIASPNKTAKYLSEESEVSDFGLRKSVIPTIIQQPMRWFVDISLP